MNRIILALAALAGNAVAFAPVVAPRPATVMQANAAPMKAAAALATSLALIGATLTPEAAFAKTEATGICAAAPTSEVCRQSNQVKAKASKPAKASKAKPAAAPAAQNAKPAAKKSAPKKVRKRLVDPIR
jgi:Mn2+/Fe2+ NRAMP family transporter